MGASLCGCGSTSGGTAPSLTITPSGTSGTVSITGPTDFTAQLVGSTDEVAWTVTGGTLTAMTGLHVVYMPPPGSAMGMLTATAGNLTAMVKITSSPVALSGKKIPGLTAQVTVQYDAQDVPHIQCAQAEDCIAVQGYLQARDRLFPMDFLRHVAEGHLAELIGPAGLSSDLQLRTVLLTRDGRPVQSALKDALDAKTLALMNKFVAGVNAYINELKTTTGAALPGEYAQLPFPLKPADIAAWTIEDTLAIGRLNQFQLSETLNGELANGKFALTYGPGAPHQDLGKMNAWIRAAAPTSEQAHTLSPTGSHVSTAAAPVIPASIRGPRANLRADLAKWRAPLNALAGRIAALRDRLRPLDASVGSNNWVVSAAKSATGAAMVANDPHLSLQYPPLFHLAAMTSANAADNLNVTGGSFPGVPGALVGRGAHVGWGVTVGGYDVTDVYMEQFLPPNSCQSAAPCVLFKGGPVATIPVPETFMVRTPGGLVDAATLPAAALPVTIPPFLLVVPHHGPIVQPPDASGHALSFRWTGHEGTTQDSKAFYGLNTATDVDAAMTALNDYATGAQNFVLADDHGNIAYYPHALVPIRNFADARITAPDKLIPPWFPLPGDGSAEWGDGTSACASPTAGQIASCWTANTDLPQGKNPAKGYFFTANADPTSLPTNPEKGVSDDNSPLAHPPYMSFDWDDSSGFRATRIEQMMKDALAAN
ncbi:MAG TPA: penicillin acylase family protein, partial [Kofleriaceae bacterium]